MKKITVLGWYGKKNIGDESYKLTFPKLFNNCEFTFTDDLKENGSDEYVLGGGDVLSEELINKITSLNKPCRIISVSANDKIDPAQINKFESVFVRDNQSLEILKQKNISSNYLPDLAFALTPNKENGKKLIDTAFKDQKRHRYERIVVVVLNGYLLDNYEDNFDVRRFLNFQKLAFNLSHMMDSVNASFLFVPFGQDMPWDDRAANIAVLQKTKFWKKNAMIYSEDNVQNVLDIIAASDATISTRLHSTIFSIVGNVPFLDITHNHKNKWLLDTLNLNDFSVSYVDFDELKSKEKLNDLINNKDKYANLFSTISGEQKEKLSKVKDLFSRNFSDILLLL